MGAFGSRIRTRSKAELLEILETGIRKTKEDRQLSTHRQKSLKRFTIITGIVIYGLLIILNLCFLVADIVLIIYPIVAIFTIITISRCYTRILKDNHYRLYIMKEEKKKLLEEVKITETYAVAKEILKRYGSSEDLYEANAMDDLSSNSRRNTTIDSL